MPTSAIACSLLKKILLPLCIVSLLDESARAEVLVNYDFNNFAVYPTPTDARTAYPTLTRGAYVNQSSIRIPSDDEHQNHLVLTYDPYNFVNPWDGNVMAGKVRNTSAAGYMVDDATAVLRDSWFAITYTPGSQTSFTHLTLEGAVTLFNPGGEGERLFPVGMVLRSSLTGWGVGDGLGSVVIEAGMEIGDRQNISFDLSRVSALQNVTEPVTFRFYMNTNGEKTSPWFYVDDIAVQGTTTVPEPASTGLLVLGGASLLLRPRRRAA